MFLCLPCPLLCDSLDQCIIHTHTHTVPRRTESRPCDSASLRPPCAASMSVEKQLDIPRGCGKSGTQQWAAAECVDGLDVAYLSFHVEMDSFCSLFFLLWPQGDKNVRGSGSVFVLNLWLQVQV